MEYKLKGIIGIALRAKKLVLGGYSVKNGIMRGDIKLVIISEGISERSRKDAKKMCEYYSAEYIEPRMPGLIEAACGKKEVYIAGCTDSGLANQIKKIFNSSVSEVNIEQA